MYVWKNFFQAVQRKISLNSTRGRQISAGICLCSESQNEIMFLDSLIVHLDLFYNGLVIDAIGLKCFSCEMF